MLFLSHVCSFTLFFLSACTPFIVTWSEESYSQSVGIPPSYSWSYTWRSCSPTYKLYVWWCNELTNLTEINSYESLTGTVQYVPHSMWNAQWMTKLVRSSGYYMDTICTLMLRREWVYVQYWHIHASHQLLWFWNDDADDVGLCNMYYFVLYCGSC